ncbi:MAG: DUF22 domain-containing protein [Archaeoglobaceae archaeon]
MRREFTKKFVILMEADIAYWIDRVGGTVDRIHVDIKPFGYRIAPVVQWRTLVASEDLSVEKGVPAVLKVKTLSLPNNTIIEPLSIMRHALGCVVDVVECGIPEKVEEEKCIDQVLFLPVESGEIREGDLVGVLKVYYVKTGLLNRLFSLRAPKVELREEIVDFNLTWRDDGRTYRKPVKNLVFGYTRSGLGYWELLIADEDVKIRGGDIVRVKIRETSFPPNTVVHPLRIMRNAYGVVVDVVQLGKPSKVEEERRVQQAVFLAIEDGEINRGDLLGVLNVQFVTVSDTKTEVPAKSVENFRMVYRSGGGIIKKNVAVEPAGFAIKDYARWEALIAEQRVSFEAGKPVVVNVKPVEVPANSIVTLLSVSRHAYGTVIDVTSDVPIWRFEDGGKIRKAVFYPIMDGEIRRGELIGVLNVHEAKLLNYESLRREVDRWKTKMSSILG